MNEPFSPGELVVCVDASDCLDERLKTGAIYTVSICIEDRHLDCWAGPIPSIHEKSRFGVCLNELPLPSDTYFASSRFDKYTPEHDVESIDRKIKVKA